MTKLSPVRTCSRALNRRRIAVRSLVAVASVGIWSAGIATAMADDSKTGDAKSPVAKSVDSKSPAAKTADAKGPTTSAKVEADAKAPAAKSKPVAAKTSNEKVAHRPASQRKASPLDDVQDLVYLAPNQPIVIRFHVHVDGKSLHEFRESVAKRIFDSLDANKNGVLEGKEIEAIPTPEMISVAAGQSGSANSSPEKADTNPADGRVTLDELTTYMLAHAGAPFALAVNGDGGGQVLIFNGIFQQVANLDVTPILAAVDANSDGRLTAAEFARADEIFNMLDTNDDEVLSRGEIAAFRNSDLGRGGNSSSPLAGLATLVQPVNRWGSRTSLARKLIQAYDRTSRDPKTRRAMRDKKLSATELGVSPASIKPFDKNGDGVLDVNETAEWLANPIPHFEMEVYLRRRPDKNPSVVLLGTPPAAKEAGLAARKEPNGQVILQVGQVPVELKTGEVAARSRSRNRNYKQLFKQADQNSNDYLEPNEIFFTNQGFGPTEFAAMDRDHNGMVFESEWIAFMELRDSFLESQVTLSMGSTSTDPVTQFDTNGDGRLNHHEFAHALQAIRAWDVNKDERISQNEIPQHYFGTFQVGNGGNGRNRTFSAMANDMQNGVVAKNAPSWFQRMDRNRDGQVSFREFLGPISLFRKLDSNNDGFLDPSEAVAASK